MDIVARKFGSGNVAITTTKFNYIHMTIDSTFDGVGRAATYNCNVQTSTMTWHAQTSTIIFIHRNNQHDNTVSHIKSQNDELTSIHVSKNIAIQKLISQVQL